MFPPSRIIEVWAVAHQECCVEKAGICQIAARWCAQEFGLLLIDAPIDSGSIGVFSDGFVGFKGGSWRIKARKVSFWSKMRYSAYQIISLLIGCIVL